MRNKIKISLSVDGAVFDSFRDYCYQNGMKISTKIEQLIKEELTGKNQ